MKTVKPIDMLKYSAGLLSEDEKRRLEKDVASSDTDLIRLTHLLKNVEEKGCSRARGMFKGFYAGKLNDADRSFVRDHLTYCNHCFQEYEEFLERKEGRIVDLILGYIRNIDFGSVILPCPSPAVLTAASKEEIPAIRNLCELEKENVSATVTDDSKGNLKVYLKSDTYDVSGVSVSIGSQTKKGFEPVASAVTSARGIANLGKIKTIPPATGKDGYTLQLKGLRVKDE